MKLEAELGAIVAGKIGSEGSASLLLSDGVNSMPFPAVLRRGGAGLEMHSFGEGGSEELEIAARRTAWLKILQQRWTMSWTTPSGRSLQRATLKWRMPICSVRIAGFVF
jgi:hypothetical protein